MSTGPFDLERCVRSGQVFRWTQREPGVWFGLDGGDWYLVGRQVVLETNTPVGAFEQYFRLDIDATQLEREVIERGPELEPYVEGLRGLRLLQPSDAVESFFGFLCTANNNLARILPMVQRLGEFGDRILDDGLPSGQTAHRFPEPEVIAEIPEVELRSRGFGYRAATIPRAAKQASERGGRDWIESLRRVPYLDARADLLQIDGIGPKLADCICLFALHHRVAVPIDTHIWQQLTRLYHPEWHGLSLTGQKYSFAAEAFRDRFGDHAGWAHQYLFYDNVLHGRDRRKP